MPVIRQLFGHHRRKVSTAFVLGGGGNLGAVQVGMLQALLERDIKPDLVVGCSVGALNGAAIASQPDIDGVKRLASLWSALDGHDIFPGRMHGPWQLVMKADSLYTNEGLRDVIDRWLGCRTFEETEVPLHVVATSLVSQRERWFTEGPIAPPLLASAALPAIFPPVWIDDEPFIDGGVVNNVPVSRAFELEPRTVYVLDCGNFDRARPLPRRPLDVLVQAFSIARSHRRRVELDEIPDDIDVVTLPAVDPGPLRYNDFTTSSELMSLGHLTASAFLDHHSPAAAGH